MTEVEDIIEKLYFLYQPIVNIRTGEIYGYEALIKSKNDFR
ncbi:EAL domain-containing protein [Sulfurihydrogenibium subterraneum]|nr:EAL domain-containing protein [Sulfurihydrogenibium subterraneum]